MDAFRNFIKKVSWNDVPHAPVKGVSPYAVTDENGNKTGLFTGYFEPALRGSRTKKFPFIHPVYAPPPSDIIGNFTRLDVMNGALENSNLEILFVDDAVDLFFAHVQGSAAVVLDDGTNKGDDRRPASLCERSPAASEHIIRIGFAEKSGHPYTAIGKTLNNMGALKPPITMDSIKAWLRTHPKQQKDVFCSNLSFIYFREQNTNGPVGASGEVLIPETSLAIDDTVWPYGLDVIVATVSDGKPFIHRMKTQDKGSAIRGVIRGDIYFGSGEAAGKRAGSMNAQGQMWVLLPD